MKRLMLRAILGALPLVVRRAARRHPAVREHLKRGKYVVQIRLRDGSICRHFVFQNGAVRGCAGPHANPTTDMAFVSIDSALALVKPSPDYAAVIDALKNFKAMAAGADRSTVWFGQLMHLVTTSGWAYGTPQRDGTMRYTNLTNGGPLYVFVRDGKIVRTTPIDFDASDPPGWVIEARGRTFAPRRTATVSPHALAMKSLVHSPSRLLHPMRRNAMSAGAVSRATCASAGTRP
jgi:trimethylamine-N-oxide reductase (cytochrome c)